MYGALYEGFIDTLKMVPFMLVIFAAIEFFEHRYGRNSKTILKKSKFIGPLIGAILGLAPQCGFSVISTVLFAEGAISPGTLISVYLATSDEAIPIILSQPERINVLSSLIAAKLIIAVLAGYIIDVVAVLVRKIRGYRINIGQLGVQSSDPTYSIHSSSCDSGHEHKDTAENTYDDAGCCGSTCINEKFRFVDIIKHSISHTIRVAAYVLGVSIILNIVFFYIGEENLSKVFLNGSILQPVFASIIGLIPNCAVSVAITQVFLSGGISFGSAIAGLSSSAGMGLIVLFKEVKSKKRVLLIILLLLFFSMVSGIILNSIIPSII